MIMVSACLKGINCKYNGGHNYHPALGAYLASHPHFVVCPESMGRLPIPRPPSEIQGGDGYDVLDGKARVVNNAGFDVTAEYLEGARLCLELARLNRVKMAILKARSPSCGCGQIYDGTFSRCLRAGDGVAAALLKRNGITVLTELNFNEGGVG